MPTIAIALWLITGGLCFVVGIYFLWKIEQSGVERWGASGKLFGLGPASPGSESKKGEEEE